MTDLDETSLREFQRSHGLKMIDPALGDGGSPAMRAAKLDMTRHLEGRAPEDLDLGAAVGHGATTEEAELLCLAEAAERLSCVYRGNEAVRHGSAEDLGDSALSRSELTGLSDRQVHDLRNSISPAASGQGMPLPLIEFSGTGSLAWTKAYCVVTDAASFLPSSFVYLHCRLNAGPHHWNAETTGCAAGRTLRDAILRGFLELVERDAFAIWWYNEIRRPEIPAAVVDPVMEESVRDLLDRQTRSCSVLDITTDLGVPVCVAVSRLPDGSGIGLGSGSGFTYESAIRSALREMRQIIVSKKHIEAFRRRAPAVDLPLHTRLYMKWLHDLEMRQPVYLVPSGLSRSISRFKPLPMTLESCIELCLARDLRFLYVDLTRTDIGIPVARAICPGLRPLRPNFGPGRLFDVPVAMAWDRPGSGMNEIPASPLPYLTGTDPGKTVG